MFVFLKNPYSRQQSVSSRHREERSDVAIHVFEVMDCRAALAMTV